MTAREFNFDGLIGPTHHFGGLAPGNLASQSHKRLASNPRAAATQGLAKMALLMRLGIPQGVLPPQPRPNVLLLRRLGFTGKDHQVLERAARQAPAMLAAASSSSSMWTANAATVCPSADAEDERVHFTPANLVTSLHRASETATTRKVLQAIFWDNTYFRHHSAVPPSCDMGDEGAANHSRFCEEFGQAGVQLFVYGTDPDTASTSGPRRYVARQSLRASQAVARLHRLNPERVVFAQQHPDAIDAGVFHNDVIAVGHRHRLFCHQHSFVEQAAVRRQLQRATEDRIQIVEVSAKALSLTDAVATYLFNSQIVTTPQDQTAMIAPSTCEQHAGVVTLIESWIDQNWIDEVRYVDVGQSMGNGGGPACLRLRLVLTPREEQGVAPGVILTESLVAKLQSWIERHYRDSLTLADLADPQLLVESGDAMSELSSMLGLPLTDDGA